MEKIKVILIEDEASVCERFKSSIETFDDIEIMCTTNSSHQAINLINELKPHAIILDLELHQGEGSGLDVLDAISSGEITIKPLVIVTTNNPSDRTLEITRHKGADYICKKYQLDYSELMVISLIRQYKDLLVNSGNRTCYDKKKDYELQIFSELNTFGIPNKGKGRKYLTDALLMVVKNPNIDYLSALSLEYNVSKDSIKKAMQRSITTAWDCNDPELLENCYTATVDTYQGSPTISAFIKYYGEKIRLS